jgi:hypothetical protein
MSFGSRQDSAFSHEDRHLSLADNRQQSCISFEHGDSLLTKLVRCCNMQSEVLPPGAVRVRPQRARSAANLSAESGLAGSMAITEESGEDAAAVDQADMEEEVLGEQCTEQHYIWGNRHHADMEEGVLGAWIRQNEITCDM